MVSEKLPLIQAGLKPREKQPKALEQASPRFLSVLAEQLRQHTDWQTQQVRDWLAYTFDYGETVRISQGLVARMRNALVGVYDQKWGCTFDEWLERRASTHREIREYRVPRQRREAQITCAFGKELRTESPVMFALLAHHEVDWNTSRIGSLIARTLEQMHDRDPQKYFTNAPIILRTTQGIVDRYEQRAISVEQAYDILRPLGFALPAELYAQTFAPTKGVQNTNVNEPTVVDRFFVIAKDRPLTGGKGTDYTTIKQMDFEDAMMNAYVPRWRREAENSGQNPSM